jgi:hypothetical protein
MKNPNGLKILNGPIAARQPTFGDSEVCHGK